jgi:hypothetical protein
VTLSRSVLLLALLAVTGCTRHPTTNLQAAASAPVDARMSLVDERKDEVLRQLAVCESGAHGDAAVPVIGGRGLYIGRFQFTPRTVITYVQRMDGRELTWGQAVTLAHDYTQAAALAKWIIFEQGGLYNWPACSKKLGLAKQVGEIKSL